MPPTPAPNPITQSCRTGEALATGQLAAYLIHTLAGNPQLLHVQQFTGGYSNLTYRIDLTDRSLVLRRPPFGPRSPRAHDMVREYGVLKALQSVFAKAPSPILLCEDEAILGAPFYLMELVEGPILRQRADGESSVPAPKQLAFASQALIATLAQLHALDLTPTLAALGRPEGYVQRQVEGWISRFERARTPDVAAPHSVVEYLTGPELRAATTREGATALIHNDYKFDNLIFEDEHFQHVRAVLDWEMTTVGDRWLDLGLSLAYWAHADEVKEMPFLGMNLTHLPGCYRRGELLTAYANEANIEVPEMTYYYVFGNFKIAGIVQQLYARYVAGHTQDPRFSQLGKVVNYLLLRAERALVNGTIE